MVVPVILAGGSGTRLWPLSRSLYPKQLLPLLGEDTLLQQTVLRALTLPGVSRIVIVTNAALRFSVAEQVSVLQHRLHFPQSVDIIIEEKGYGTAAAIGLAAHFLPANAIMWIMAADHYVADDHAFSDAVASVAEFAKQYLISLGVKANAPETGYGYIALGACLDEDAGLHSVDAFVEKPDLTRAKAFVTSGRYCWNAGFVFGVSCYLNALQDYAPEIAICVRTAMEDAVQDLDFIRPSAIAMSMCPNAAVDYAVMEKSDAVALRPVVVEWSDIGAWEALYAITDKDAEGNVIQGNVVTHGVANCFLESQNKLLLAAGVTDLVVVNTEDALLITDKKHSQQVGQWVKQLAISHSDVVVSHRTVYRPWGQYTILHEGQGFKVKSIEVKPGARLSLQSHAYRSEHWVVISSIATAVIADQTVLIRPNESAFIPIGVKHQLRNETESMLVLIEVQVGSRVDESDIHRYEDHYGRVSVGVME